MTIDGASQKRPPERTATGLKDLAKRPRKAAFREKKPLIRSRLNIDTPCNQARRTREGRESNKSTASKIKEKS